MLVWGTLERGRMNPTYPTYPNNGCTCMRPWMSVLPPPPCPVHHHPGQHCCCHGWHTMTWNGVPLRYVDTFTTSNHT